MTQEEFDKAPLANQILYDTTGMLAENHPHIVEAMEKYHQAKLKLLRIEEINDLKRIRDYFGKHDKSSFEHWAFAYLNAIVDPINVEHP